jgi:hypothetical protein
LKYCEKLAVRIKICRQKICNFFGENEIKYACYISDLTK